jgi:hypothetical protein
MSSYQFITAVVLVHNLAFGITHYFKTKDLYRYNILYDVTGDRHHTLLQQYESTTVTDHAKITADKKKLYSREENGIWHLFPDLADLAHYFSESLYPLTSDQPFFLGGGCNIAGGHSTEWFVYTYLTIKFTYWYYTHSELLIGVDCLLTLAANPKINLSAVL